MGKIKKTKKPAAVALDAPEANPGRKGSWRRELPLAFERIGGSPARRLRWLLEFANYTDLDSLSEGRFSDLRWEVVAFGLNRKPEQLKNLHDVFFELTALRGGWEEGEKGAPPELVRKFQSTMQDAFDALFKHAQWKVKRPSEVESIALDIETSDGGGAARGYLAQNPPSFTGHDFLLMQAIDLIKAERGRLKICHNPKCKKRFVAAKKGRAFFHSAQCSALVRVNRARGRKLT